MSSHAKGPFQVTLTPAGAPDEGDGSSLGALTIAKVFHGDLEGTSRGTMLTASSTGTPGSAAYVAVERVDGVLGGKHGSFSLVHRGVMSGAGRDLVITIVPDSGAGELTGISGSMTIAIAEGGAHSYELSYTLP
ncbi:DUF3224 domain-containing protein [Luteibacter yeojuensis]|uniref:DUF3224 domain-containing protein n=1 Tax=Luteibacter yeojuensis TaxID=345309 RepID=A0A7X5TQ81_9GAMM|nr:DUF3224 domain-containing protein [Luteibacter yeojuensis]NID15242.1 DUF3224 domain-containing protein [Luteibacter yeojuensis]